VVKLRADGDVTLDSQGASSAIADRAVARPSLEATPAAEEATPTPSPSATVAPEAAAKPTARPTPKAAEAPAEAPKVDAP
jgi:hypothetical protein